MHDSSGAMAFAGTNLTLRALPATWGDPGVHLGIAALLHPLGDRGRGRRGDRPRRGGPRDHPQPPARAPADVPRRLRGGAPRLGERSAPGGRPSGSGRPAPPRRAAAWSGACGGSRRRSGAPRRAPRAAAAWGRSSGSDGAARRDPGVYTSSSRLASPRIGIWSVSPSSESEASAAATWPVAAVDEEQVGEDLGLGEASAVAAENDLGDHGEVVGPLDVPDPEAPVLLLLRRPPLENDERTDRLVPLEDRDVHPLDAARERGELQQRLERGEHLAGRGERRARIEVGAPQPFGEPAEGGEPAFGAEAHLHPPLRLEPGDRVLGAGRLPVLRSRAGRAGWAGGPRTAR